MRLVARVITFVLGAVLLIPPVASGQSVPDHTPQRSRAAGLFIGLGLEGDGIVTANPLPPPNADRPPGSVALGEGLVLGYGFNSNWSAYGQLSTVTIDDDLPNTTRRINCYSGCDGFGYGPYALRQYDLGVRIHLRAGSNVVVPFLQAAYSGRLERQRTTSGTICLQDISRTGPCIPPGDHMVSGSGNGVSAGVGMNVHFRPAVALSFAVAGAFGQFRNYKLDGGDVSGGHLSAATGRLHVGLVWFPRA